MSAQRHQLESGILSAAGGVVFIEAGWRLFIW
jgi:hypothetical protein